MPRPSDIDAEQRQTEAVTSWDDDPNNAQNWSNAKKALNMSIITFLGFLPLVQFLTKLLELYTTDSTR